MPLIILRASCLLVCFFSRSLDQDEQMKHLKQHVQSVEPPR